MSDSSSASANEEDIPPSINTSQALSSKSHSCPELSKFSGLRSESSDGEDPTFNLTTLRTGLEDEEITDDIPMFTEFPSVENQEISTDDVLSESSDEHPPVNLRALRRKILDESEASQEATLNITDPSELNQSPWTFVCHLNSAKYLKFAVEALRNPELSCQGEGRIDVDDNGFNITVQNSINFVVGHLRLKPARFQCTRPLNGKRFSFVQFSQELDFVEDEATVFLANHKETDTLNVRSLIGDQNTTRFFVDMSSKAVEIHKFPDMALLITATVPSDDFRQMVDYLLQQQQPQQVSVDIKDNNATLRVGNDNSSSWTANYAMLRADGCPAMEAEENHSTIFQWDNAGVAGMLQKARELDAEFLVLFHAGRPKNIILRFSLGDMGYLEFMRDSAVIVSSTPSKKITRS